MLRLEAFAAFLLLRAASAQWTDVFSANDSLSEGVHQFRIPALLQTAAGTFMAHAFRDTPGYGVHLALVRGEWTDEVSVPVRVHEPLSVIDLLDVKSASHSWNFNQALAAVSRAECGVIVFRPLATTDVERGSTLEELVGVEFSGAHAGDGGDDLEQSEEPVRRPIEDDDTRQVGESAPENEDAEAREKRRHRHRSL